MAWRKPLLAPVINARLPCNGLMCWTFYFVSRILCLKDRVAGDGWTPELLDIADHELGAGVMVNIGGTRRIVHRVGQVTHKRHRHAPFYQLLDTKRTVEDTHIRMHPHDKDLTNAMLLEIVVDLLAIVRDA